MLPWCVIGDSTGKLCSMCCRICAMNETFIDISCPLFLSAGCPACGDERKGYTSHPPLAVARPDLAAEWAWERNGDKSPDRVTLGSGLQAWWVCSADPEHPFWRATVQNRSLRGTGCPACFRAKLSSPPRRDEVVQS